MAAKPFAVGDVLPATTQLRIKVDFNGMQEDRGYDFQTTGGYLYGWAEYALSDDSVVMLNNINITRLSSSGRIHIYVLDISTLTETQRTIVSVDEGDHWTWEDLNASSGYTITFNSNGGTTIPDIEEATELPTLPIPTRSGYTFVAWYYESNFQTRAKAGDTIESNVTLYAKWHNLGSLFTEIADAIRSKDGTSENIRDVDFGERVKQIQGAIELTQAQYDALETKDANTYYLIVEEE